MKYFIIRQKSTGYFFPQTGRGSTHAEFGMKATPRLFISEQSARSCLRWWKNGPCRLKRYTTYEGEYDETLETEDVPERQKDDYEILPVTLWVEDEEKT